MHVQPQWGLRVGAANKALSTKGSWRNSASGNYVSYEEGIRNVLKDHIKNIVLAREAREYEALKTFTRTIEGSDTDEIVTGNAYATLVTSLNDVLDNSGWSALDNIVEIKTNISDYISLENENVFKNLYDQYNTSSEKEFEVLNDPNYSFGPVQLVDYHNSESVNFAGYLQVDLNDWDPDTNPSTEGWYVEVDENQYEQTSDESINSTMTYYINSNNMLLSEI